jgi:hypothetical protein
MSWKKEVPIKIVVEHLECVMVEEEEEVIDLTMDEDY